MMPTWHGMWLDNKRTCDTLQYLICVPDVLTSCTFHALKCVCDILQIGKLIFMMPFVIF